MDILLLHMIALHSIYISHNLSISLPPSKMFHLKKKTSKLKSIYSVAIEILLSSFTAFLHAFVFLPSLCQFLDMRKNSSASYTHSYTIYEMKFCWNT